MADQKRRLSTTHILEAVTEVHEFVGKRCDQAIAKGDEGLAAALATIDLMLAHVVSAMTPSASQPSSADKKQRAKTAPAKTFSQVEEDIIEQEIVEEEEHEVRELCKACNTGRHDMCSKGDCECVCTEES